MSLQTVARRTLPRVRVAPRAAHSDHAEDAAFLSSSYGLTPDDWQADVLEGWLSTRRDGRWAAATCGLAVPRQNGKNGVIEIRELYGMVQLGEKFLHTAHEVKTARKAFLRIVSFFENERQYPELAALVKEIRKTNGQEAVVLKNGASVEFIARSKGSGRGFTVDVLVCDEAQDLTDEAFAALLPTISAAPLGNPQVILTGTPPDPEKPERGEVFLRVREDGSERRDPRLAWTDFGVPDGPLEDIDLDDPGTWQRTNPALGVRLNVGEVERERRLMSAAKFAHERLGWWGDPAEDEEVPDPIFGEGVWPTLSTDERLPELHSLGIAASLDQSFGSIGGASGLGVSAVDRRRHTSWLVQRVVDLQAEGAGPALIDDHGPAADLIPLLRAAGAFVEPVKMTDYLDACTEFYRATQDDDALTYYDPDGWLTEAVDGAAWRDVGDRRAFGRKQSTSDVSMLEAVTLARRGVQNDAAPNIW